MLEVSHPPGHRTRYAAAGVGFWPAKAAVLDSLRSPESKRRYRHAVEHAGTINGRLAAVRRLAYEAADPGLLSPELAASIRRVKGAKKLGVRLGNWLTPRKAAASGRLLIRTR